MAIENPVMGAFVSQSLAATGSTAAFRPANNAPFNITVSGTWVGTVIIERTFDSGATWVTVSSDSYGTAASYTANFSVTVLESQPSVLYRVTFTRSSGTAACLLSQ